MARQRHQYLDTTWNVWSFDVWGNRREGYEVNDRSNFGRDVPLRLRLEVNNAGTPREFLSAYPTDAQIRELFDLRRFKISLDGDDVNIGIERERDGYPIGEMNCTSHESLAPPIPVK